jgi:hypothetical protein
MLLPQMLVSGLDLEISFLTVALNISTPGSSQFPISFLNVSSVSGE